jgi:hypothetical protein
MLGVPPPVAPPLPAAHSSIRVTILLNASATQRAPSPKTRLRGLPPREICSSGSFDSESIQMTAPRASTTQAPPSPAATATGGLVRAIGPPTTSLVSASTRVTVESSVFATQTMPSRAAMLVGPEPDLDRLARRLVCLRIDPHDRPLGRACDPHGAVVDRQPGEVGIAHWPRDDPRRRGHDLAGRAVEASHGPVEGVQDPHVAFTDHDGHGGVSHPDWVTEDFGRFGVDASDGVVESVRNPNRAFPGGHAQRLVPDGNRCPDHPLQVWVDANDRVVTAPSDPHRVVPESDGAGAAANLDDVDQGFVGSRGRASDATGFLLRLRLVVASPASRRAGRRREDDQQQRDSESTSEDASLHGSSVPLQLLVQHAMDRPGPGTHSVMARNRARIW